MAEAFSGLHRTAPPQKQVEAKISVETLLSPGSSTGGLTLVAIMLW